MERSLGKKSSIVFGILALLLLVGVAGSLLLRAPEAAGGPIQTNAAPVSCVPGVYTAQISVDILNAPDSTGTMIGRIQKGTNFQVYEVQQQGNSYFGLIARNSDNWALLKDDKIVYAALMQEE